MQSKSGNGNLSVGDLARAYIDNLGVIAGCNDDKQKLRKFYNEQEEIYKGK